MHTVEEAKAWAEENKDSLAKGLQICETIPQYAKQMLDKFQPLWNAGEWLEKVLREDGASDEECSAIGFSHGQRSFGRDTWEAAVLLANEHMETGTTNDRPGAELGRQICVDLGIIPADT